MYYVLHKPYGAETSWLELDSFRSKKTALEAMKTLRAQTKPDGSRLCNAKLCIGKGRDRREILIV